MSGPRLRLDDFLPYRLSYTSNLVSERIADIYRALFGISIPEWRIVAWVAEAGGITQQAIGAATRMDKVTVSRATAALVARAILVRQPNPADRRSHLLVLGAAGEALHAAIAPQALALEQRIFARFPPERLALLNAMLREIDEAVLALPAAVPNEDK